MFGSTVHEYEDYTPTLEFVRNILNSRLVVAGKWSSIETCTSKVKNLDQKKVKANKDVKKAFVHSVLRTIA